MSSWTNDSDEKQISHLLHLSSIEFFFLLTCSRSLQWNEEGNTFAERTRLHKLKTGNEPKCNVSEQFRCNASKQTLTHFKHYFSQPCKSKIIIYIYHHVNWEKKRGGTRLTQQTDSCFGLYNYGPLGFVWGVKGRKETSTLWEDSNQSCRESLDFSTSRKILNMSQVCEKEFIRDTE